MSLPRPLKRSATVDSVQVGIIAALAQKEVLDAAKFHDGSLLSHLAAEHIRSFKQLLADRMLSPDRPITWGSACSGSAGDLVVCKSMEIALQKISPSLEINHLFSCESNKIKRAWIQCVHDELSPEACLFTDVTGFGASHCYCTKHQRKCELRSVDVFACCTSCKDFSRERSKKTAVILNNATSAGQSAQTFHGMLAFLDTHRPTVVLFENVDSIEEDVADYSNMDIVVSEFASRGYEVQKMICDSFQFGLPQHRRRMVAIAVLIVANPAILFSQNRTVDDMFRTVRSLIKVCVRSSPCASQLLLPEDHPHVLAELKRRMEGATRQRHTYNMKEALDHCCENNVSWASLQDRIPLKLKQSPWYATLTARECLVLAVSLTTIPASLLFRDVSCSVRRGRVSTIESGKHCAGTVMPTQSLMVFQKAEHPRLLLGREAMLFQGFPINMMDSVLDQFSSHLLTDLAGNMVSCPVMLALAMAAVASVSWRSSVDASATELPPASSCECMSAFTAFNQLMGDDKNSVTEGSPVKRFKASG